MEGAELVSTKKTSAYTAFRNRLNFFQRKILDPLTEDHAWRDARQRPARKRESSVSLRPKSSLGQLDAQRLRPTSAGIVSDIEAHERAFLWNGAERRTLLDVEKIIGAIVGFDRIILSVTGVGGV
jgi:hypothetical protein